MIARIEPYAYYLAIATRRSSDGTCSMRPQRFPSIYEALDWAAAQVAIDMTVVEVAVSGIDTSAGFADQVQVGRMTIDGWQRFAGVDLCIPLTW